MMDNEDTYNGSDDDEYEITQQHPSVSRSGVDSEENEDSGPEKEEDDEEEEDDDDQQDGEDDDDV